jgi:hypothetical protein
MATYYAQGVNFSGKLSALHLDGCHFQQYIIDIATKTKHNTLNFLVLNQAQLRVELYQRLVNMVEHDVGLDPPQMGQRIVFLASFCGSPHFMMQAYQDAMAIVRNKGIPNVFLTFICNSNW